MAKAKILKVDKKYSEPGGVMEEAKYSAEAVANNEVQIGTAQRL